MKSRLLSFSIGLNLVLLGIAGYWAGHSSGSVRATPPILESNSRSEMKSEGAPVASASAPAPAPLRWRDLESEDYPTYIANLRKAGCPEPVLRRIIAAELKELYARKAFALVQDFHRDFWEIAARENVRKYFETTLGQQVNALSRESDALLRQLLGEVTEELRSAPSVGVSESRFADFLSAAKREQLRNLASRYEPRLRRVRDSDLPLDEKAFRLAQLREEMESEQSQILSPEELAEYQLRQSAAASELQQLHGVDFSETELRNLAKAIDDYHRGTETQAETDSETLEQKLQNVLGPQRFADFNRARSASYRELYELASEFGRPPEAAAEVFDLRLQSEKQSDAIRSDKNRSAEEKQLLLDALQDRVEHAVLTRFGAPALQSYKAKDGRWIDSLGRP